MPTTRPVTRLKHGEFYADILPDRRGQNCGKRPGRLIWFYVVQRHGSADILAIGSCASEQEAINSAAEAIREYKQEFASAA